MTLFAVETEDGEVLGPMSEDAAVELIESDVSQKMRLIALTPADAKDLGWQ